MILHSCRITKQLHDHITESSLRANLLLNPSPNSRFSQTKRALMWKALQSSRWKRSMACQDWKHPLSYFGPISIILYMRKLRPKEENFPRSLNRRTGISIQVSQTTESPGQGVHSCPRTAQPPLTPCLQIL